MYGNNRGAIKVPMLKLIPGNKYDHYVRQIEHLIRVDKMRMPEILDDFPPILSSEGEKFVRQHIPNFPQIFSMADTNFKFLEHAVDIDVITNLIQELRVKETAAKDSINPGLDIRARLANLDEEIESLWPAPKTDANEEEPLPDLDEIDMMAQAEMAEEMIFLPPYLEVDLFNDNKAHRLLRQWSDPEQLKIDLMNMMGDQAKSLESLLNEDFQVANRYRKTLRKRTNVDASLKELLADVQLKSYVDLSITDEQYCREIIDCVVEDAMELAQPQDILCLSEDMSLDEEIDALVDEVLQENIDHEVDLIGKVLLDENKQTAECAQLDDKEKEMSMKPFDDGQDELFANIGIDKNIDNMTLNYGDEGLPELLIATNQKVTKSNLIEDTKYQIVHNNPKPLANPFENISETKVTATGHLGCVAPRNDGDQEVSKYFAKPKPNLGACVPYGYYESSKVGLDYIPECTHKVTVVEEVPKKPVNVTANKLKNMAKKPKIMIPFMDLWPLPASQKRSTLSASNLKVVNCSTPVTKSMNESRSSINSSFHFDLFPKSTAPKQSPFFLGDQGAFCLPPSVSFQSLRSLQSPLNLTLDNVDPPMTSTPLRPAPSDCSLPMQDTSKVVIKKVKKKPTFPSTFLW